MGKACFIILAMALFPAGVSVQSLTVEISGIRTAKGVVRVSVFGNAEDFEKERPLYEKTLSKSGLAEGKLTLVFSGIPPGRYGIAVLDDENENGKMDYRWLLPAEGFGFSGYTLKKLRRPRFEEFRFDLNGESKTVKVQILYW